MNGPILLATGIVKSFTINKQKTAILQGVDLQIAPGEIVALVGKSGSGKSTLLNILSGLDVPDEGSVIIDGCDIAHLKLRQRAKWRLEHIGFVFQNNYLQGYLTLEQNIMAPAVFARRNYDEMKARCHQLVQQLGISERLDQSAANLSGGEVQRAGIARALMNNPKIIFADEPTGNLDPMNTASALGALRQVAESGTAVVIVTHDERVAAAADRVLRLAGGRL